MGWLGKLLENIRDRRAAYLEQKNNQVADKKAGQIIPATNGRHGMAVASDPFSFQAAHRRLAWMLRMSAGMNIVRTGRQAHRPDQAGCRRRQCL